MTMINVTKRDETSIRLSSTDSGSLMEVSEFFTFYAEGYKYMPSYKNKMWDGKIRLFDARSNTLPYGLLAHLAEFARSRKYSLNIANEITNILVPTIKELEEYANMIPLSVNGKRIPGMRDYQFDGFSHAIRENRALLLSPTGSGT